MIYETGTPIWIVRDPCRITITMITDIKARKYQDLEPPRKIIDIKSGEYHGKNNRVFSCLRGQIFETKFMHYLIR